MHLRAPHQNAWSLTEPDWRCAVTAKKTTEVERLLLTRRQVAELLGDVDVSYVRNLEAQNLLTPIRLTRGGMVFFERSNVLKLIANAAGEVAS